ncbi:SMI1/KNR4 family protein [Flavobacterium chungangense]|uniref:SMI1/KNR4 family protein n=2 Tax=Flavobacterium chungangense TaxID=554283 RepID=UPI0004DF3727|nr:SMI1/KNR4 family protein [Flavobacterium chungangense]
MINKILETLKGDNDNKFFDGVSEAEINDFESKINVKLPDLLKKLYLEINGGYDGSLLEFYSLEKVKNIDNFDFGYFAENKSGKNIIWSLNENDVKKCFIKNYKFYYSFMNYNFGGAYWFINLNKYDKKYGEILLLYNHLNEYYKCQSNIDNFFKLYTDYGSIEILLDSEIEIKKYLKEK